MFRTHFTLFLRLIVVVTFVFAGALFLIGRISSVNAEVSRELTPSEMPGVWELNTREIDKLPWEIPDSCGMTSGYYEGIDIVDVGEAKVEDYDTFVSHAELPADYLDFDSEGTVEYVTLSLTFRNNSDESVLIQFSDFWLFCGIVPGSCAQALLPQFNQDTSSTIESGCECQFAIVYRILRNGFSSESEWNRRHEFGYQLVVPAYPNKYIVHLSVG